MQRNTEIIATAYAASVGSSGGLCPECGTPANANNVDVHQPCILLFQREIEATISAVVVLLNANN